MGLKTTTYAFRFRIWEKMGHQDVCCCIFFQLTWKCARLPGEFSGNVRGIVTFIAKQFLWGDFKVESMAEKSRAVDRLKCTVTTENNPYRWRCFAQAKVTNNSTMHGCGNGAEVHCFFSKFLFVKCELQLRWNVAKQKETPEGSNRLSEKFKMSVTT